MPAALSNLAALLQEEKRWPEAAAAYQAALARHPDPADSNNYGVVLLYLGRTREAARAFRRALAGDPTLFSAHYNLYKIALAAGDSATANSEMAACSELDPSFRQN
jgi:Tfp pilus assembly protein PilF